MGLKMARNSGTSIHINLVSSLNRNQTRKSVRLLCMGMLGRGKHLMCISDHVDTYTRVHVLNHRTMWSTFKESSKEMLHGVQRYRQPCCCLWRGDGDFPLSPSLCCSSRRGQLAVIKPCLHLSLSLSSAGGRLQQQGAPDSQTTSLLPTCAEAASSQLWGMTDTFWPGKW